MITHFTATAVNNNSLPEFGTVTCLRARGCFGALSFVPVSSKFIDRTIVTSYLPTIESLSLLERHAATKKQHQPLPPTTTTKQWGGRTDNNKF